MNKNKVYIGVDVAKETLEFHGAGIDRNIANRPKMVEKLLKRLPPDGHVVCEATGPYQRALVRSCHQAGVPISVVNPRQVRRFAQASGHLAKTDGIDALVLMEFGQKHHPRITLPLPIQEDNNPPGAALDVPLTLSAPVGHPFSIQSGLTDSPTPTGWHSGPVRCRRAGRVSGGCGRGRFRSS